MELMRLVCDLFFFFFFFFCNFEGDQFKVNMGEKKLISKIDIEMYLTLLDNRPYTWNLVIAWLGFYLNLYTNKINYDLQVKDFNPTNC